MPKSTFLRSAHIWIESLHTAPALKLEFDWIDPWWICPHPPLIAIAFHDPAWYEKSSRGDKDIEEEKQQQGKKSCQNTSIHLCFFLPLVLHCVLSWSLTSEIIIQHLLLCVHCINRLEINPFNHLTFSKIKVTGCPNKLRT